MEKIIHYCWFGPKPLPKLAQKCIKSWEKYMPDYEIKLWNEENVDLNECEFIKEAYHQKKWAFVADYTRTKVLNEYGGIYMDTDMELQKSLEDLITEDFVIGVEDSGFIAAGLIIVRNKKNKYIKKLLETYKKMDFSNEKDLFKISIPKILTKIFEKEIRNDDNNKVKIIKGELAIYPRDYFYPLSYDRKNNCFTNNTYGIHYYDASWLTTSSKIALWLNRNHLGFLTKFMYSFLNLFKNKTNLIISIVLSLLFVLSICNFGKYEETKLKITSLGEKNKESKGYQVIVDSINSKLTNNSYKIKKMSKGWHLRGSQLKNDISTKSSVELILPPVKSAEIKFVKTRYSGKVLLVYNNKKHKIDLYEKKSDDNLFDEEIYTYKLKSELLSFLSFSNIAKIMIIFIIFVILNLIWLKLFKKNKNAIIIPISIIFLILFTSLGSYKIIYLDFISLVLLFLINIIIGLIFSKIDYKVINKYFETKFKKILFLIMSFINSFIFAGYQLFLSGDYMNINLMILAKYLLLTLSIMAFELSFIYLFEKYNKKIVCKEIKKINNKEYFKKFVIIFGIFFGIWFISLLAHYPVNMTSDTADQWAQAIGIRTISTAHPAVISIYYKILHNIGLGVFGIGVIQVFIFSIILSSMIIYFYKKGIRFYFLCALSFIIAVLPSSFLLVTTLWKDVPYTLFLTLMVFYTYRLITEKKEFLSIKGILFFSLAIAITYLTRHNGIGPLAIMIIFLIAYSIYLRSFKPTLIVIITLVIINLITGPVFTYFKVYKGNRDSKDSMFVNTLLRSTGAIVKKEGTVRKDYMDIVETNMSKELLIKYFDPFNGDTYGFTPEIKEYLIKNNNKPVITTKNVIDIYLWELINYPNIIIKERLDATSLFWTMFIPDGSFNHKYADGIYFPSDLDGDIIDIKLNEYHNYSTQNIVVKVLRFINKIVENIKLFDCVVWRSGFSLLLTIVLSYILIINNKAIITLSLLPMVANMTTWVLLMSHQSFRYVWYINLILFLFILIVLLEGRGKKHEKKN
ncbi:MAG: glycosyltransferase [Bacilli bacterium]